VRWSDCLAARSDNPVHLRIIGESQAGVPFDGELTVGTAVRISTGAMLPAGADTVVRIEDCREDRETVAILAVDSLGKDVRQAGEEFCRGDLLFPEGTRLGPRELALLASVGRSSVPVFETPQVSLLITGTELARPDDPDIQPHQIRDSNSIMLSSAVQEAGARLRRVTHIQDDFDSTTAAIRQAFDDRNAVILCSGGVSVGRHDHVKEGALAAGFTELFWKISQKPGKPLFAGRREETLLFGLPGNPVSAYMCFHNYVQPVLARLQGTGSIKRTLTAQAGARLANKGKRTNFIRVSIENRQNDLALIREMALQGSHMLSSIVHADGYIVLSPGEAVEAGSLVEVYLF